VVELREHAVDGAMSQCAFVDFFDVMVADLAKRLRNIGLGFNLSFINIAKRNHTQEHAAKYA